MSHLGVPRQIALTIASFPQIVFGNLKFSLMEVPANGDASASSGNIPASLHVPTVASHRLHDGAPYNFLDVVLLHYECDDGRGTQRFAFGHTKGAKQLATPAPRCEIAWRA
jgi:hypothetical protein